MMSYRTVGNSFSATVVAAWLLIAHTGPATAKTQIHAALTASARSQPAGLVSRAAAVVSQPMIELPCTIKPGERIRALEYLSRRSNTKAEILATCRLFGEHTTKNASPSNPLRG